MIQHMLHVFRTYDNQRQPFLLLFLLTVSVDKKWVQTKEKTVDSYDSSIKPNMC